MSEAGKGQHQRLAPKRLAGAVLGGMIGITLLSLTSNLGGNIVLELASHFKRQYLLYGLLSLGLLLLMRRRNLILVGLFCAAILLTEIVPWYLYTPGIPGETAEKVRVLSSNISPRNRDFSKVLALVRQEKPDVAVFMEVTNEWVNQLQSLDDILPYSSVRMLPARVGMMVLSRIPLEQPAIAFFGTDQPPIQLKKASILATLMIQEQPVHLIAAHLATPVHPTTFEARNKQLNRMSTYVQQLKLPVVLVGDLNTTQWSPYYRNFVHETGLRNTREGRGILPTWPIRIKFWELPSVLSWLVSIPIDHCLISPNITVADIRTGSDVGSDHLPLIIDLVLPAKP
ncbi:endonuclease/exonuclease/phosphatase family protein [Kovacikia minuta CCNUW1]|uniref:endonuclease/exonuclease/phosphatase family protein n=1 Tax=Kovacikia minuta TaxID=2931930 RepID=UPI001CCD9CCE|nr:endonuclease/exonuclease/phosphatase family protein [Kovacikia minuta]UBF29156.1 endonuclease/exonuclease/phosphatase family protein [Kovacikia minuta CCNUW1]